MRCVRHEVRRGDSLYPEQLLRVERPPATLYCVGDLSLLAPGLAVVGSRRQTPYGRDCTMILAGWAATNGVTVISGAAVGCDQSAHRAAIDSGGRTVAVLGCGADLDYPPSARRLLETVRRDHLVVSELPWGTPPARWTFPERNRIIAGLAAALLVVEASLPSGTFSTADHALQAGTEVLAVPGSILSPLSRGTNRLIRDGAGVIADVDDLALALARCGLLEPGARSHVSAELTASAGPIERMLAAGPRSIEEIAAELAVSVHDAAMALARLELSGAVRRSIDGRYCYAPTEGRG
ncbi:DNA-processing protein DprA [Coriobacteriia bacterium Es71-Z0120]|uniref:DNA-processing protein DprA n=1 Tax=Parvivirga hydrogeniphila TaxID=2939460 RepID=UPI00226081ED|nr:DNA-processing protein DprA [Parvivirga hydrogeniphila]MCL4079580.1 DNA-processing protein DprA [Parvivirga hydrogeniphila]